MTFIETVVSLDTDIMNFVQNNMRFNFLDGFMEFMSNIGEIGAIWLLLAIIFMFFKKTRATGVMLLVSLSVCLLIGEFGIKSIVCRPRPFIDNPAILVNGSQPSGFSFPSGHSASSFAAAMVLILNHKKTGIVAMILASLIAFSRLYNGVHYPSDIICGILLGIIVASIIVLIFKKSKLSEKMSS